MMAYKTLWIGLGIIAGWLAALLGLSFYVRRRIGPRLWRRAHKATIVVYALGVVHTLGAGTDASSPWLLLAGRGQHPGRRRPLRRRASSQGIRQGPRARTAGARRAATRVSRRELPPDVEIPPRHRRAREIEEPAAA